MRSRLGIHHSGLLLALNTLDACPELQKLKRVHLLLGSQQTLVDLLKAVGQAALLFCQPGAHNKAQSDLLTCPYPRIHQLRGEQGLADLKIGESQERQ